MENRCRLQPIHTSSGPLLLIPKQPTSFDAKDVSQILDIVEPDAGRLEVWSYSPKQFGEKGMVDRFSLFLSMRENNDERVQSALSAMMEQVQW